MRNREARDPFRYKFRLDDGTILTGHLERDDDPVIDGTPLNMYTLLKDETAKMLGMNPETAVPDDALQMLAALASSGSGSGDTGEMEDFALEVGEITNAAAGWCSFRFRRPFDGLTPRVFAVPVNFMGYVQVNNAANASFQYCVRTAADATTADKIKIYYLAVAYGGE